MFIPNSPRPPRGIAVSVCVGLLKKSYSPLGEPQIVSHWCAAVLDRRVPLLRGGLAKRRSFPFLLRNGILPVRILRASVGLPAALPGAEDCLRDFSYLYVGRT